MPTYRCYFIRDQRIADVEVVEADGDAPATNRALELMQRRNAERRRRYSGIELWDLDRLIHAQGASQPEP
jgi:hypothetical protein